MKRNYQKPMMMVVKIGLHKMIAASPTTESTESFSDAQSVTEGTANVRAHRGGWDWGDED